MTTPNTVRSVPDTGESLRYDAVTVVVADGDRRDRHRTLTIPRGRTAGCRAGLGSAPSTAGRGPPGLPNRTGRVVIGARLRSVRRSVWPRLPRWWGLALVVRLAWRDVSRRRWTHLAAACVGAMTGAVLAWGPSSVAPVAPTPVVLVLAVTVAAGLAGATDPAQRREAELLERQGCPRYVLRLAAWTSAAATVGWPAGAAALVAGVVLGVDPDRAANALAGSLLLPAIGAWFTAGARLPERRRSTRVLTGLRLVVGALLILLGSLTPTTARSGFAVDLLLPFGLLLVLAGLMLVAPVLVGRAGRLLRAAPSAAAGVAGGSVERNRRGLTIPVAMVTGASCLLVVQAMLGEGLGRREQHRVEALRALGPASIAGSERVLLARSSVGDQIAQASGGASQLPGAAEVQALMSGVQVAAVEGLPMLVRPGRTTYGEIRSAGLFDRPGIVPAHVALASPGLLEAVGLDRSLAAGSGAVVLDSRVLRPDGSVRLDAQPPDVSLGGVEPGEAEPVPQASTQLPAIEALPGQVVTGLPAVLVPPAALPDLGLTPDAAETAGTADASDTGSEVATDLVVRFPRRPTDEEIRQLAVVSQREVVRGDRAVDLAASNRTDAVDRRTRMAIAALRGLAIGTVGTAVGVAIAYVATRSGLAVYNESGRLTEPTVLAPIPVVHPPSAMLGLVALPLIAAAIGAVVAAARPAGSRLTRAERLAW